MSNAVDMLNGARDDAGEVTARHKKHASFRLYSVLSKCMAVVEACERDPQEHHAVENAFLSQPYQGNRRFVEKGQRQIYILVCRYVFERTNRANAIRYAQALEQAALMQIGSDTLETWMRDNGGVNALYYRRKLKPVATTKTMRLNQSIEFPRDRPFTLTLEWSEGNVFKVLNK